jgi:hypothetical protein
LNAAVIQLRALSGLPNLAHFPRNAMTIQDPSELGGPGHAMNAALRCCSLLFLGLLLVGCSNQNLTGRHARHLIETSMKGTNGAPLELSLLVYSGHFRRDDAGSHCDDAKQLPYQLNSDRRDHFIELGYVSAVELTPCGDWSASLSTAVKPLISSTIPSIEDGAYVSRLTYAKYKDLDITGILQDGPRAVVDVHHKLATTLAGRMLATAGPCPKEDECTFSADGRKAYLVGHVSFTRYDDGWRLDKQELHKRPFTFSDGVSE